MRIPSLLACAFSVALLAVLIAGCEQANEYVPPPPPPVTVAQPLQQQVTDYLEFTGTTEAVESVEVRARVKGFLESMSFEPGADVKKDDLLFVIDPKPFQARVAAAKADVASAKAQLAKAESDFRRREIAGKKGAVTEAEVVGARADRDAASADVGAAEAALTEAELNLGYTRVTAPITGRASRNLVDVGNLVGSSEPTLLTTITAYSPIYAYFNLNERDLLGLMEMYRLKIEEKGLDPKNAPGKEATIPLFLGLANETGYPHEGVLDFAESGLDAGTGTLQARAVFPNADSPPLILPGLFVRLRMPVAQREQALLVTERALGADQGGKYLLAVNAENVVEKRPVTIAQTVDGMLVINEGLRPDDWVVVNGVQKARPGGQVAPERTDMAGLSTSARESAAEEEKTAPAKSDESASAQPDDESDQAEPAQEQSGDAAAESSDKP